MGQQRIKTRGQTMMETATLLGVVALGAIAALSLFGGTLSDNIKRERNMVYCGAEWKSYLGNTGFYNTTIHGTKDCDWKDGKIK